MGVFLSDHLHCLLKCLRIMYVLFDGFFFLFFYYYNINFLTFTSVNVILSSFENTFFNLKTLSDYDARLIRGEKRFEIRPLLFVLFIGQQISTHNFFFNLERRYNHFAINSLLHFALDAQIILFSYKYKIQRGKRLKKTTYSLRSKDQ